jgi:nucleotide-binding universal stress UspA family protein
VEVARERHRDVVVDALVLPGDPRDVLIDLADTAHMVVLGSRGRGTVRSLLLGSVSTAISKHAACPVVICRPPRDGITSPGIVVGADGTPASLPVIEFAFEQASLRGLPLTVLHAFWDVAAAVAGFREASAEVMRDPDLEELRLVLSESVAGFREKYPDVQVSLLLRHGLVDEALSPRGKAWDLVVVGRHDVSTTDRILTGSIATAVIERTHSNVAVVPEAGPRE